MYRHFITFTIVQISLFLCLPNNYAQQRNRIPDYTGSVTRTSDSVTRIGKGYVYDLEFSPDGTKLAVATTLGFGSMIPVMRTY